MTKETEELIKRSYQEALAESTTIFGILNNLYRILKDKDDEVAKEDKANFEQFISKLKFNYGIVDTSENQEGTKYATT